MNNNHHTDALTIAVVGLAFATGILIVKVMDINEDLLAASEFITDLKENTQADLNSVMTAVRMLAKEVHGDSDDMRMNTMS